MPVTRECKGGWMRDNLHIKVLIAAILLLTLHFQYRVWFGDGSMQQIQAYQLRLDKLLHQAKQKQQRNDSLYAEVLDLRKGKEAIEEIARHDLGMIKKDETFFQVIE
jgi:cell division protein FtsB